MLNSYKNSGAWKINVLFAVLTCNRLFYLKNCVNSILEFVDLGDAKIMILDNCTKEPGIKEYIGQLPDNILYVRFEDRVPNELYRAMNYAISWCIRNNVSCINFIQDDYQYLFKIPDLLQTISDVFDSHKDVFQVQTNLTWQHKSIGKHKIEKIGTTKYAILQEKLLTDNGFTLISSYEKIGMYPDDVISYDQNSDKTRGFGANRYKELVNGELWFGNRCKKHKMKRALSLFPNMGMLFDCAYVRKWQRFGKYFSSPEKYYFKPLEPNDIEMIFKNNRNGQLSYINQFCKPWGWEPNTFKKHNMSKAVEDIDGG